MRRRTFLSLLLAVAIAPITAACAQSIELTRLDSVPVPPERGVNFGFEDVSNRSYDWPAVRQKLADANASAVSLAVGRVEWVAFDWQERPEAVAVSEGEDLVQKAIDGIGDGYTLSLVIDTLVPQMIDEDSSLAGQNPAGEKSKDFASVTAIRDGEVGDRIVELAEELAGRYDPDRIVLTELMFDDSTFGDDDLASFKKVMKKSDWPRTKNGDIDVAHESIGRWRSEALEHLANRIQSKLPSTVQLELDVRAPWDNPDSDRALSGHDYEVLLQAADRVGVWNYNVMNNVEAEYSQEIAESMDQRFGQRYTMSTGLWGDGETATPEEMALSLRYSAKGGARSVSVTPASMMNDAHWQMLNRIWSGGGNTNTPSAHSSL